MIKYYLSHDLGLFVSGISALGHPTAIPGSVRSATIPSSDLPPSALRMGLMPSPPV